MNVINGTIGYLPPESLYDMDVYQVWQTPFARGGLEQLTESLTETIQAVFETTPPLKQSGPT